MKTILCGTIGVFLFFSVSAAERDAAYSAKNISWFLIRHYISLSLKTNPMLTIACLATAVCAGYKVGSVIAKKIQDITWYCYTRYCYYQQNKLFWRILQYQKAHSEKIQQTNQNLSVISEQFSGAQSQLSRAETISKHNEKNLETSLSQMDHAEQLLLGVERNNSYISQDGRLLLHDIETEWGEIDVLEQEKKDQQEKTKDCFSVMQHTIVPKINISYATISDAQDYSCSVVIDMATFLDQYSGENRTLLATIQQNSLSSLTEIGSDIEKQIQNITTLLTMKKEGKLT